MTLMLLYLFEQQRKFYAAQIEIYTKQMYVHQSHIWTNDINSNQYKSHIYPAAPPSDICGASVQAKYMIEA